MTETVLLALDTSTEFCSVALLAVANPPASSSARSLASSDAHARAAALSSGALPSGDAPDEPRVWLRHEATGAVSSTRLLPAIRELFDEAGVPLHACSAIAFGAGPGSFTGLRTATGVAQGLAFGLGCPVVPIGTLVACAESARRRDPSATRVLAALDARMDEVYWADYAWDDALQDWRTVRAAALDAPERVEAPDGPYTLAGNAAAVFGERLAVVAGARSIDGAALPHALPIAFAALRAWRAGRAVPADQAAPDYVRDKVALTTAERLAAKAAQHTPAASASAAPAADRERAAASGDTGGRTR
ncbi:tRNA (adenosine(37)-N6)-threonylcarbamoyltransferase complex dimerization subunit type 1 TsaB [Paraburkholderia rhizosphaerae]|uniref:tRNA threonylcarbamoyladenosine biosynthesis protein TsaB n=1 Tax=Paraburkholderia rhizosphaerae TaxID=480658 RepID=A0A4R8LG64_9BURK|nr:tRNA (adenosine(37)-N6)-threonylcarbamoyltransferase complex dimerization subunit type 1 TsaB [Paraburkholderia rhizosphaerae]TDY42103.1 tRNA threonylcarbamoyladenosine biosynthesis protein TsaB [Paraburkholderia rhizosphaerae]